MNRSDLPQFEIERSHNPTSDAQRLEILANPGFGRFFTDHMVTIRYSPNAGWHSPTVKPYGPIALPPAAAVLHYAQEIFEGMKAYHRADGKIGLFRPEENARRFQASAERLAMPPLPQDLFLASLHELLEIDKAWVPDGEDTSLYLRPFMFASEEFLGVRPSNEYLYCLIASPAGAYFKSGPKPVSLWASADYTRAAPGGTGSAKCGGNYATSLLPQSEAIENGCEQVVFLDAVHRQYVDELGGMNIFFVYDNDKTIVTPQLGTILPGITRDAVFHLAEEAGYRVVERQYSIEEWRNDSHSGDLSEVFACGTAAVVTPVGTVRDSKGEFGTDSSAAGPLTMKLRQKLLDLQHGKVADPYGWTQTVS